MNERIKELITEAWGIPAFKISDIFHWDREEKFAQLIVRECIDIAYEYDAPKMSGPGMIIGNRIEQHFGVEE